MFRTCVCSRIVLVLLAGLGPSLAGCSSFDEYLDNGYKVGPNYCPPAALVAEQWIDQADIQAGGAQDLGQWWKVFRDPTLDRLITTAHSENLTLREASYRVLQARALVGMARGELFPQMQTATGGYQHFAASQNTAQGARAVPFFDQWNLGFNLAWELDFWGRLRRAVAAADAQLDASVEEYDQVLVTLLGDVASNYVQIRTDQERIRYLRQNVAILDLVRKWTERRDKAEIRETPPVPPGLNMHQITSTLEQSKAGIPQLEMDKRIAENRLCVLLGMPPADLRELLGEALVPTAPAELAIGIPADLLRRRPDVQRAERQAAAQSELIGLAKAELYPAFSLVGTLGWGAQDFPELFSGKSLAGNVGPTFQWKILNYGRIANHVRFQDAKFQELTTVYQQTVLQAAAEAENGLATFLQAQDRKLHLQNAVDAATAAVNDMFLPTEKGQRGFDFNRFALIEQNRTVQQDLLAQTRGEIAQGLIQVYRALGGGWELRLESTPEAELPVPPTTPPSVVPEGEEELQRLRNLLDAPLGPTVAKPEPVPRPAPEPSAPTPAEPTQP